MPPIPAPDSHASRRSVLFRAAALLAALPTARAYGHDATPAPAGEQLLFVQVAESGAAQPITGQSGQFNLTLANGSGQTLYFSDRPERIAGIVTTRDFISDVASAAVRPNAALVFRSCSGDSRMHVAALELSDPAYDSTSRSITYTARMLTLGDGALTADDLSLAVDALPTQFGDATLFIDDYDIYITGFVPGKRLHQSVEIGRTTP